MSFEALGLHASLVKAVTAAGYTAPTPVQEQAIPAGIAGRDMLVSSQTGSGKTAAFMLPALHQLAGIESAPMSRTPAQEAQSSRARGERVRFKPAQPKVLVLTPTRELALQVTSATEQYTTDMRRIRAVSILGGMPYPKQMQLLAKNPEILVATPGRLIDHMESGKIDFSELKILVLDEADRMLDMGFIEDIEKIVDATPSTRQTMLFSATLDGVVGNMARRITNDPLVIQIASATKRHENIVQKVHFVDDLSHKNRLLDHLLRDETLDQAVVFTATKRDADMIADRLNIGGFAAAALHGDMHQGARNRTLDSLRRGRIKVLVATDVAARGIDVPNITHVVNYDLPKFPEDYVHRIGRTGRAGRNGIAISLVNHAEGMNVRRIERFTKQPIPVDVVEGFEPKRATPATRPGWKPGDGRNGKPGQRSFGKPSGPRQGGYERPQYDRAPREGQAERPQYDRAPRTGGQERPQYENRYADRGPREGQGERPQYADRAPREGAPRYGDQRRPAGHAAPREGNRFGGQRREGGYKGAHPRSMDGSRRSFGE